MSIVLHPDIKLGEVKLKVSDLPRSIRFYEDIVGLTLLAREEKTASLGVDGSAPLLVLEEVRDAVILPRRSASGLYHFAILVPTRKALGLALRNLIASGIHIGQADHLVSEALYIEDPDHNGIEIYRDRPRNEWPREANGQVKMASDPIDWDGLLKEAEGSDWEGLPAGTVIGHVHFHVGDLAAAKAYYCDTVGFEIATDGWRQMGALFIAAGGYHHHIGLNLWSGQGAPAAPANAAGLAYFTLVLTGAEELERVTAALREAGVPVEARDGACFATDSSGITMRLVTA
ncbi:VOC family protein [Paenibacillus aurantiacus]|uniref:VOC family protein n=1 Tax=Paenibacillus aurantiacus TaxID=1936118 RepID=A0ABV5KM35_9BACL